ncbi:hypothetical protein Tco_0962941 [Tanacetum coccineum]
MVELESTSFDWKNATVIGRLVKSHILSSMLNVSKSVFIPPDQGLYQCPSELDPLNSHSVAFRSVFAEFALTPYYLPNRFLYGVHQSLGADV